MTNFREYQGYAVEDSDAASTEAKALSGNMYMDLEVGDNLLRFLPLEAGQKNPYRATSMHYVDPLPGMENKAIFACPRVELKQVCPACTRQKALSKSRDPADQALAKQLRGGLRVFACVINRASPNTGPVIVGFGKQVLDGLKALRRSPRLGGDFTNPGPKGFDVVIHREGTGKDDTVYTVHADRTNSPLAATQEEIDAICAQRHNLEDCVHPQVPEVLAAIWARTPIASQLSHSPILRPAAAVAPAVGGALVGTVGGGLIDGGAAAATGYDPDLDGPL